MAQDTSVSTPSRSAAVKNGTARLASPRTPPSPSNSPIPQKHSSSGLWLLVVAIILAAIGLAAWYFLSRKDQSASTTANGSKHKGAGADVIRVVGAKATTGDMGVYLTGLGAVTPLNSVTVTSRVQGQLMQVAFQEGQLVKEGDLLDQIDDRPYKAQVAQYTAQKEHDEAVLDDAKVDLQRYQKLWSQDSIPKQTLDTQVYLVKQDQGTVDSDQAQIDTAELNIEYCHITAPINGRVGLRLVDVGNQIQASSTTGLVVLNQVQPIKVYFTIPEDSIQSVLDKLNAGQALTVEAYSRDNTKKLAEGTLRTTDNQIDPTTGTLKLEAIFQNDKNELFPNQFVNVKLLVETKKDLTIVPVAAIQHGTQGTFVFIVNPASTPSAAAVAAPSTSVETAPGSKADASHKSVQTVALQNVTVGTIDGDQAEIDKGISAGDTVVVDGVDKLQDGSKVILQMQGADTASAAAPDGTHKHGGKHQLNGSAAPAPNGDP